MLSKKQIKEAKLKYESHESLKIVAEYFKISRSSLTRIFKKNGIVIRSGKNAHKIGSKIPLETQNKIFELNSKRIPLQKISKELKVSYGALHSLLKRKNLLWGRRMKELPKEEIANKYKSGFTINQLSINYPSNPKTIRKILGVDKISIRSFKDYKKKISNLRQLHKDMIKNNKSLKTIAADIGISKFILKQRFLEKGLKLRSKSDEQEIINLEKYPNFDFEFFSRETKEALYWIGFIAADGAVVGKIGKKLKLTINLKYSDKTHLQKLSDLLRHGTISQFDMSKYEFRVGYQKFKGTKMVRFEVSSSKLCRSLVEHGITPRKTHSLELNKKLKKSKDFWRGYIDGDGSLTPLRNKRGNVSTVLSLGGGSKNTIRDFIVFLNSFGIETPPIKIIQYKKPFYTISISGERARHAIKILYADAPISARLERKYKTALKWLEWSDNEL